MRKVLVLGATGMLGITIYKYLSKKQNIEVFGSIRNKYDEKYFSKEERKNLHSGQEISKIEKLENLVDQLKPEIIINCIGLIKQLELSHDPLQIIPVNALFPHKLSEICRKYKSRLIHFSTDCVFSGSKGFYKEVDEPDARDLYGLSKLLGEVVGENNLTIRTSIIGPELRSNNSLLCWFLSQKDEVKGYQNAIFSGLPTIELSRVIYKYVIPNNHMNGLYHISAEPIDKYSLLKMISKVYKHKINIIPDSNIRINRSLDSTLFRKITNYKPPSWYELLEFMKNFH